MRCRLDAAGEQRKVNCRLSNPEQVVGKRRRLAEIANFHGLIYLGDEVISWAAKKEWAHA